MANYNKSVNFAVKDTLTSGDPNKIVSGAEIDTEFNNISSASTTKIDKVLSATTGNIPQFTATGAIEDSGENQTSIVQIAAPAGVVMAFGGSTAPTGWLECDGSAVSRSTYSDLFSAIGTNFGVGDGSITFNLPDTRGEFIRGWDNGRGADPDATSRANGGDVVGSTQSDELKSHTHTGGYFRQYTATTSDLGSGSQAYLEQNTGATGGSETRPRNVAMMYIIKA